MLFNDVIAFDHYRQKVLLITGVMTDDLEKSYKQACEKLEEMTELIKKGEKKIFPPIRLKSEIQPQFPKEKYCQMVETAKHYIHEGDIFQVVLSNPMRAKAEGSLFDTYRVLRATNPSPYMFYFSNIVSSQIYKHVVLGKLFFILKKISFQCFVLFRCFSSRPCSCQWESA